MGIKRRPPPGNVRRVAVRGLNARGIMTNKAGRLVQYESQIEYSIILRLDQDTTVLDFGSQPEEFQYRDVTGKQRTHVPDFIVWRTDGSTELCEVALLDVQLTPNYLQRLARMQTVCQDRRWRHVVYDENTIPSKTEYANLLALLVYRPRIWQNSRVTQHAFDALGEQSPMILVQLVSKIAQQHNLPTATVRGALAHDIWSGTLSINWNHLLFMDGTFSPQIATWVNRENETSCQK